MFLNHLSHRFVYILLSNIFFKLLQSPLSIGGAILILLQKDIVQEP